MVIDLSTVVSVVTGMSNIGLLAYFAKRAIQRWDDIELLLRQQNGRVLKLEEWREGHTQWSGDMLHSINDRLDKIDNRCEKVFMMGHNHNKES